MLSEIQARTLPKIDKEKEQEEYLAIVAVFEEFIKRVHNGLEPDEAFEELVALRAEFGIRHAIKGFDMDWEEALELVRSKNDLSEADRNRRDILVAAIDNIVDFAAAEEYQMVSELPDLEDFDDEGDEEDGDGDFGEYEDEEEYLEALLAICAKYNKRYARVENLDIEYAMIVAAALSKHSASTVLMYMTMGDERVRPWHLQYEGYTAPKSSFPAWLIPPIEHACRCYLVEDTDAASASKVSAVKEPTMPEWFDRTFKESVALGGRIFSDEHPYFQIDKAHIDRLKAISLKIKDKYFNG